MCSVQSERLGTSRAPSAIASVVLVVGVAAILSCAKNRIFGPTGVQWIYHGKVFSLSHFFCLCQLFFSGNICHFDPLIWISDMCFFRKILRSQGGELPWRLSTATRRNPKSQHGCTTRSLNRLRYGFVAQKVEGWIRIFMKVLIYVVLILSSSLPKINGKVR